MYFVGILIYHIVLKVTKAKLDQTLKSNLADYLNLLIKIKSSGQNLRCRRIRSKSKDEVTYSEVSLEEPLILL